MPVNPLVLQEIIKKYGIDKIRKAKDNVAKLREKMMFDNVSDRIAGMKLPGQIVDEPLVPMEQEIMSYTDAGDPIQMYEAGQMVANGDVLPGISLAALTLAPQAIAKGAAKAVRSRAAENYVTKDKITNRLGIGDDVSAESWDTMADAYKKARDYISSDRRKSFEEWLDKLAHSKGYLKDGEHLPFEKHHDNPTKYYIVDNNTTFRGRFNPNKNVVEIASDSVVENTPVHEFLHSMRLGNTPHMAYPEYMTEDLKKFYDEYHSVTDEFFNFKKSDEAKRYDDLVKKLLDADPDEAKSIVDELNSSDYAKKYNELFDRKMEVDAKYDEYADLFKRAEDFRKERAKQLLDPQAYVDYAGDPDTIDYLDYLSNPHEAAVTPLAVGMHVGVKPFSPYPGDEAFDEFYKKAREASPAFWYYRHETPQDKRILWNAMRGTFLGGAGLAYFGNKANSGDNADGQKTEYNKGGLLNMFETGGPTRKERRMFDRVSKKIANQKLPGEIRDEPLVPFEKQILDWTDVGDAMQLVEAGNMIANGQVLPGVAMAGLTVLPRALAEPVNKVLRNTVAKAERKTNDELRRYARENGLLMGRERGSSGQHLFISGNGTGDMYYLRDGLLLPYDGRTNVAGSASPGNGGVYRSANQWSSTNEGTRYGLVDRGAYPEVSDFELESLANSGSFENWTQSEFEDAVRRANADNLAARQAAEAEAMNGRTADRLSESLAAEELPPPPPEVHNPVTGEGIEGANHGAASGSSSSPIVELRTPSGVRIEPGMDIESLTYDDLTGILNDMSNHSDDYLEDAGLGYEAAATLRARVQHAIDHNGQDLFSAWNNMEPEELIEDARRMYPGFANDLLSNYGKTSGRMQEILDEVEYQAAANAIGRDTDSILSSYLTELEVKYSAEASPVGSSSKAYEINESELTPFENARISGIAKVLNRKLGRKAGVDFTKYDTVDDVAKIQKALRDNELVSPDTVMPLDIAHMAYFSGDTNAMSDAGRRAMRTVDEQPAGSANLVDDTSTASTPMRPGIAAKRYGDKPGQVTVRFSENPLDKSGYRYVGTNSYDTGFNVYYDQSGRLNMGPKLEASIRKYVDPNFDASLYNFTPEEYIKLQTSGSKSLYPDLHKRWVDMTVLADKASIGPMLKYQGALETAIRKSGIEGTENFIVPRARLFDPSVRSFYPTYQPGYEFPWMGIYKHRLGGYLKKFEGGGSTLQPAKVTAERPRDFGDFSSAGQKKISDYALAVRQGTISLNDVPESYRGATYQRIITLGTDKAAETIGKVGLNTALALSDPVGYAAGLAAQKGLAYANDAASGRNEYAWSDALGYTPIMGTEYAAEHPVASALADIAAGAVGGGVIRNAGNIARNAEQAAQNAAAVSGMEREVLSYQSVGRAKTFGTVYKSGTKGSGKTGAVRSAKGSYGYSPIVSAKGVFSNESSGAPSIINWYKPDAALPVSPVPFNGPGVPPIFPPPPVTVPPVLPPPVAPPPQEDPGEVPTLTIPGMSVSPQDVYNRIHQNRFYYGGVVDEPVKEGDSEFVGPPVPASVRTKNNTTVFYNDLADTYAKSYPGKYPNLDHYLRRAGELRGEQLAANERAFLRYDDNDLIGIRGTQSHNVRVPRAVLDSLALNGAKAGVSPIVALGLPAQETNFGFYPTASWNGQQMREWGEMSPNGYAIENGGITPIELLNDAAYSTNPYGNGLSYVSKKLKLGDPLDDASHMFLTEFGEEDLDRIEAELAKDRAYADRNAKRFNPERSVFRHAYDLYRTSNYNPGDPNYEKMVEAAGADVFTSPQIQGWWNAIGRKYYEQYAPHLLEDYRKGGKIHIKPSKKGTFTAAAKKHGKSVQAFASQVLANPGRYSAAMRKKANFARNAAKWHEEGGLIDRLKSVYGNNSDDIKAAIIRAKNVKK